MSLNHGWFVGAEAHRLSSVVFEIVAWFTLSGEKALLSSRVIMHQITLEMTRTETKTKRTVSPVLKMDPAQPDKPHPEKMSPSQTEVSLFMSLTVN